MKRHNAISATSIRKHFEIIYGGYKDQYSSFNQFLEQNLFFVTVSFRVEKTNFCSSKQQNELREFRRLHFKISEYLLGNNLNRKRTLQPLTYAFVDFEGSRQGRSDPIYSELPHIHALVLVRPEHLALFKSPLLVPRLRSWVSSINDIEIKNFSEKEGTFENLASYCMKGHKQTSPFYSEREDLWAILPA